MNISFDADKLYETMTNFYNLTKIRIVFFDDNFNKILSVPQYDCEFCTAFMENPTLGKHCISCDENARSVCRKTSSIYIYTCHAGLTEAIFPLKFNGIILGYIMLGQIIDKSEKKKKKDEILSYAYQYIDKDLDEAYSKLTTKSKKQINAAANIMEACACYLWVSRLVQVNEDSLAVLISRYIDRNLTSDLSVDALCSHFHISRNKLYKISHDTYGISVAAYVRKKRVSKAASLLKSGYTVADAAISSGFEDYNYFSEIFKKETGIIPSKYACSHK